METTITRKGQVTIPKHIRDALGLRAGSRLEFDVDGERIFLRKAGRNGLRRPDRFDRAMGAAEIKLGCSVDEYMELIRDYSSDPRP
jgi:antitoxin PrlF